MKCNHIYLDVVCVLYVYYIWQNNTTCYKNIVWQWANIEPTLDHRLRSLGLSSVGSQRCCRDYTYLCYCKNVKLWGLKAHNYTNSSVICVFTSARHMCTCGGGERGGGYDCIIPLHYLFIHILIGNIEIILDSVEQESRIDPCTTSTVQAMTRCRFKAGPPSATLKQHQPIRAIRRYWDTILTLKARIFFSNLKSS